MTAMKTIKEAARKAMQDTKSYAEQYDIKLKDYERYCTFAIQCEKVLQSLAVSYEPNQTEIATKVEELINSGASADEVTITHILNNKSGIAFTSYSHTGLPVPVFAIGNGSSLFEGYYDNTDIFKKLSKLTGVK